MNKKITTEMLDRTMAWCLQNMFWPRGTAIQRMQDFYIEKTRASVNEDWPGTDGMEAAPLGHLRYRIYYSKDLLTSRVFIFRPHCTWDEQKIMLDMGFVVAQEGDADNIPDQPVEEGVEE
jgi:hypothetical protein